MNTVLKDQIKGITLLSIDDYEQFKELIPLIKDWWWLRTPGSYKKNESFVFFDGDAHAEGYKITAIGGIRPVFILSEKFKAEIGELLQIGKYEFTYLGENLAISNGLICKRRFDAVSNSWEHSELKSYLENEFAGMV